MDAAGGMGWHFEMGKAGNGSGIVESEMSILVRP